MTFKEELIRGALESIRKGKIGAPPSIEKRMQRAPQDRKYGTKGTDYRPGMPVRQAPAMILPEERSPEMIREEEDIMDA